jgi:CRISPR-associated protein Cas1
MPSKNIEVRIRQHRAAAIGRPELAAAFVSGKIRNARTLLRRHGDEATSKAVAQLAALASAAATERRIESLLGIEGTAARLYFEHFGALLRPAGFLGEFAFEHRNRRPPTDPVNALLSFLYALLIKDATIAALAAGLEPYLGLYHQPKFGRPALALDLAEEFRALVADSTVLTAVNNGEISRSDFVSRAGAVSLTQAGRKKVVAAYERRMASDLRHPLFGYKATYRRTLEIQARLLAATLVGDTPEYRPLTTR